MRQRNKNFHKGFTLVEMLLVLSICLVISSVVVIGVATVRANMNKLTASESAKEIYIAAENKLLELKELGLWDEVVTSTEEFYGKHIDNKPSDFDYWQEISGVCGDEDNYSWGDNGNMFVLESSNTNDETFIRETILPEGSIDDSIVEGATFFIELNAENGVVYGVYYCLDDINYSEISSYRDKEFEVNDVVVGYFGGGILSELEESVIVDPYIKIINGEELTLKVSTDKSLETRVDIEIEGENSNKKASINLNEDYTYSYNGETHALLGGETSEVISYEVILDSLTRYNDENKHFASLFPDFYPGENILITVYIRPDGDYLALPVVRKYEVNSLFNSIGDNIYISTIRHFENLDNRISGLDEKVSISNNVEFLSNISFSGFGEGIDEDVKKNYLDLETICTYDNKEEEIFNPESKSFYPVNLSNVNKIIGNGYKIYDISINLKNYENTGLIGLCNKITIENLGIVGSYESEYLKYPSFNINTTVDINAGAFIGKCESAKITGCYSTTKININNEDENSVQEICVGGFIGLSNLFVEINKCYGGGIVDSNGVYEDSIKVETSLNEKSSTYLGGFVGYIESDDFAEAFIYKSYQTQSLSITGATNSNAWIFEGGFIGGMRFDDSNVDIDSSSYMAAPIKSDIKSVTLQEITDYKNNGGDKRKIRFGGIIGGFKTLKGEAYNNDPQISIEVFAKYINYFADYCGVPELLSNNEKNYDSLIKLKDIGLYYRNNYGISVDVGNLVVSNISKEFTYPISDYLLDCGYSFRDPTNLGHHFGDWQVKEYGTTIKITLGHGISSVNYNGNKYDENTTIVNYGEETDMSMFKIVNEEGYEGNKYELIPKTDGSSGILIENNGKYTYIAGVGTCEFLCTATSIKSPNLKISGGGEFIYNYEDVILQITNTQKYGNDITITFSIIEDDRSIKEENNQVKKGETFSTNYTILKNAYRGNKNYKITGKVSDGILESDFNTSNLREVIFSRVKVIFNENDVGDAPHGVVISPASYGYVEYDSSNIYKDEISMETITPSATRSRYKFLGWSIPIGSVYKPTKLNDINNYALWKKMRNRVYTYSEGGWFYD